VFVGREDELRAVGAVLDVAVAFPHVRGGLSGSGGDSRRMWDLSEEEVAHLEWQVSLGDDTSVWQIGAVENLAGFVMAGAQGHLESWCLLKCAWKQILSLSITRCDCLVSAVLPR
jgi:hypothetical protein